jgi:hypothetical protein
MRVNLYTASVGVFGRGLNGLSATLRRGTDYAAANGIGEKDLLGASLHPTMYPLYRQAQTVCDLAGQGAARIAGLPVPEALTGEPDTSELQAQIAATRAFLASLTPAQIEGRDDTTVTFPIGADPPVTYPAAQYLLGFVTQNFFFHFVSAYAILRHIGVDLGKRDYFGS